MHCLWTLPEGDADFPSRWRAIKIAFSKSLPTGERRSPVMITRGERGIWQRRYWEHTIRDERDFAAHMDYTHFNPVKHGLAEHPADWPHSSFRRCLASGLYPAGWVAAANHKGPASGGETETAEANAPERQESAAFSAHSPSGLLPAHLCSGRTSAGDGWWRNALRFSALRFFTPLHRSGKDGGPMGG